MPEHDSPEEPSIPQPDAEGEGAPAEAADSSPGTPAEGPGPVAADPVPLAVPLEEQIRSLPPLEYPGSPALEQQEFLQQRRRTRLRIEVAGGVLLLLAGIAGAAITQRTAFIAIALFAVVALVAYEFLVDSFQ